MLLLLCAVDVHVPTYTDKCDNNCCHPAHDHTTSQVVYLKGDGGLEMDKFDLKTDGDGEIIDYDVVFKRDYDTTTYDVYVGCGGCASGSEVDELLIPALPKQKYQPAKLEPFTQTAYFPLLPQGQYDTRQLAPSLCESDHWSIRIVDYGNRTKSGHETLVWGAVLGCDGIECEKFTLVELLSFPIYVLRNHGEVWNDEGWTFPLIIIIATPFLVFIVWLRDSRVLKRCVVSQLKAFDKSSTERRWDDTDMRWVFSWRCFFYAVATWALVVDLVETLVHFAIAVSYMSNADGRGYGLFGFVIGFGKLVPILLVSLIWNWHRVVPELAWRTFFRDPNRCGKCCTLYRGLGFYSPFWAHGCWSVIELPFIGIAGFVWLGAGFFVFPVAITFAGLIRLIHWLFPNIDRSPYTPLPSKNATDSASIPLIPFSTPPPNE